MGTRLTPQKIGSGDYAHNPCGDCAISHDGHMLPYRTMKAQAQLSRCSFCAQPHSDTKTRRHNPSSLLRSDSIVGSFMRTVWPALWHQLTVSMQTAYACRRCFPDLDTCSKRLEALSQSISKLEGSFSSSEYYPSAVRTTLIFTQPFDSFPRSLATTLCIRSGSTVSLTKGSSISAVPACDRHVICSLLFMYLQSDWSPRIARLRQEKCT